MDLQSLRQLRAEAAKAARTILDVAEEQKRDLTAEEESAFDRAIGDVDKYDRAIDRELAAQEAMRRIDSLGPPDPPDRPDVRADDDGSWFREWLRTGRVSEQVRAAQVAPAELGGYLQPPQEFVARLIQAVDDAVAIRGLATVMPLTQAESLGVPTREADVDDFDWTTELGTGTEDTGLRFGKRELRPHPLAKRIKVSKRLLRVGAVDPEQIVIDRLGYKVGATLEKAYMSGDGSQKPLGLFVASSDGISTSRDSTIGSAGTIPLTVATADQILNAKYMLKAQYHPRARWMFHRDILLTLRKLKDADDQYIWRPGFNGSPDTLDEIPYVVSEFAPNTVGADKYVGILGDFSYYWIVDSLDFQIQRLVELYAESNQDGFIGRYEGDGMPVLEEAFVRLVVD